MKHILLAGIRGERLSCRGGHGRWWMALVIVLLVLVSACGGDGVQNDADGEGRNDAGVVSDVDDVPDDVDGMPDDVDEIPDDVDEMPDDVDEMPDDVDELPSACADGTFDHDDDPATACVAWSDCAAGMFVANAPSATERQRGGSHRSWCLGSRMRWRLSRALRVRVLCFRTDL